MTDTDLRQRLAAILAADAAGYSRLMAADDRATVAALDAARSVFKTRIEAHQGRVIDMAGDSVLAVFDTATGAVATALSVQEDLRVLIADVPEDRRMRFRIGIHLGDVIQKADGTVYGDGVNIAARLEGLAEPGGVTVSESIRTAVRGKVGANFEDQGEQTVKNIPDPVRAYRVRIGGVEGASTASGAKAAASVGDIDLSLPDKPSIAVLPFTNMSGDPEQEYFTDGITEDIITELSRFHSLFVIARNSTFTYKGKPVDVRTVAKELGVRYVLEGSIRKASNRVRVTAQLSDAQTGSHLWAEKYDRVLEDIFAVQEEITRSIVAAIAPQIDAEERAKARRRRPESLRAYDLALRASADAIEAYQRSDFDLWDQSLAVARKALATDPRSLIAHEVIAALQARFLFMVMGTGSDSQVRWNEGADAATRLIELDPTGSSGYAWMAMLMSLAGRGTEALANVQRGRELNPNDALTLIMHSYVDLMDGRSAQALEDAQQAVRLSPRDPNHFITNAIRAAACFFLREHRNGLEYARLSVAAAPNWPVAHSNYLIVAVGAGDLEGARNAFEVVRRLAPAYVDNRLHGKSPYAVPEHGERYRMAYRVAAGLEDPGAAESLR